MKFEKFIKNIRFYATISFILPLIAINGCLFLYKLIGKIEIHAHYDYSKEIIKLTQNEYNKILFESTKHTFVNCPKYFYADFAIANDGRRLVLEQGKNRELFKSLNENNEIKFMGLSKTDKLNKGCVKNYPIIFSIFKNFSSVEAIFITAKKNNSSGFAGVKNPYFYGEVSISRTARYFPATLIFKPLIILSAFFLFLYWKNNFNIFNEFKNRNIITTFHKSFLYFGILSCIFLGLHAALLGVDIDSKIFQLLRRSVIILFIVFEICAQIYLTRNFYKFKKSIKNYAYPLLINIKIIFVSLIFCTTIIIFCFLAFVEMSSNFKHFLEWNYFSILLIYYVLSRLLWKM